MIALFERTGDRVISVLEFWGNILSMIGLSFRAAVFERSHAVRATLRVIAAQTYFTGAQAMTLIFIVAFSTGSVLVFYTTNQSNPLSGGDLGSALLYVIVGRELGPMITGFIVIARSGTAVASELGNMRANGETDALRVMAIDPLSFIVFPRLVAGILSVVCLVLYFDFIALMGGFITSNFLTDIPMATFITNFIHQVELEDILVVLIKSFLMGATIFSISSYQGLQVRKSHHEVPQVTIKAVVVNIISVTVINFLLTAAVLVRHFRGTEL